jgi:hypothetical protein
MTSATAVVVLDDSGVHIYRTPESAAARVSALDAWTAYDITGRQLHATGGWHREWQLLGGAVSVEHGRRLEPRANEPPHPEVVRSALARDLHSGRGDEADSIEQAQLIDAWVERNGWDD